MVALTGCSTVALPKSEQSSSIAPSTGGWLNDHFIVDGIEYSTVGEYDQREDGTITYSFVLVSPQGQYYFPATRYMDGEHKGEIYSLEIGDKSKGYFRTCMKHFTSNQKPAIGETKIADVPFHHTFFIDNGKIVFQKSNEELGIVFSDPENVFNKSKPILAKLIREHGQSPKVEKKSPEQ
jgi:hypothetical protein